MLMWNDVLYFFMKNCLKIPCISISASISISDSIAISIISNALMMIYLYYPNNSVSGVLMTHLRHFLVGIKTINSNYYNDVA